MTDELARPRGPFEEGPFVRVATFCDRHMEEKDGVSTIIRVIDRYTTTIVGPAAPQQLPEFLVETTLVVLLTSGAARGSMELQLRLERPSGIANDLASTTVTFGGGETNARLVAPMRLTVDQVGLYWMHVLLDGLAVTRVPLRVEYRRVVPANSQTGLSGQPR